MAKSYQVTVHSQACGEQEVFNQLVSDKAFLVTAGSLQQLLLLQSILRESKRFSALLKVRLSHLHLVMSRQMIYHLFGQIQFLWTLHQNQKKIKTHMLMNGIGSPHQNQRKRKIIQTLISTTKTIWMNFGVKSIIYRSYWIKISSRLINGIKTGALIGMVSLMILIMATMIIVVILMTTTNGNQLIA